MTKYGDAADAALVRVLESFGPDREAPFVWLRPRLTEDRLMLISILDYGDSETAHRTALQKILSTGRIPSELKYVPHEVVQLCLHELANDDPLTGYFAAVVEIATNADYDLDGGLEPKALALLVSFALKLGPDATRAALSFVSWRLRKGKTREPVALYHGLAAAILAAAEPRAEDAPDALPVLAAWLERNESVVRGKFGSFAGKPWLIGIHDFYADPSTVLPAWWSNSVGEVLGEPTKLSGDAADAARRIAAKLA